VEIFGIRKRRVLGLSYGVVCALHDPAFSSFGAVLACDGRTDRHNDSI